MSGDSVRATACSVAMANRLIPLSRLNLDTMQARHGWAIRSLSNGCCSTCCFARASQTCTVPSIPAPPTIRIAIRNYANLRAPNRVEVFAVALVIVSCVATWECFTAWGIMAASVGAQVGQVPQAALAETRERAQLLFGLMVLFQVTMLASAVWFVGRKRVAVNVWQCFRRPSNWLLGAGLMLVIDVLVFAALLERQMALADR